MDPEKTQILISREHHHKLLMTKFPGGGLEFGEGLAEGLRRELMEELSLEANIGPLFYINDFFQASAFRATDQLLSVYYEVNPLEGKSFPQKFTPVHSSKEDLEFFWISLQELHPERMSFPIDKWVVNMLRDRYLNGQ